MARVNAAVTPAAATTVTLAWNANSETDLQGYRVFVGTESGQYSQSYDAGTSLSFPVDDLVLGQTYYFAVTVIGSTGLESLASSELMVTIARPPLPTGSTLASNAATGSLSLKWVFPVSALGSAPEFIVQVSSDLLNWSPVATVAATDSVGRNGQLEEFSWPIPIGGGHKFYRLTAKNWLGESAAL